MIHKLYPRDQIMRYLLIDVISIVCLFYMVLRSDSALGLWGNLALLLVFLLSFYFALWYRDWRLLAAVLVGIGTLALLGIHVGSPILLFGFIFADLLGRARSRLHIIAGIAAIALLFVVVPWNAGNDEFGMDHIAYIPIMIVQMLLPVIIAIREKTKRLQSELDAANKQIETYIQQEERQRIARDLHDTLGQTLTMIKMKSELAAKWVDHDPRQAKEELKDILATSRIALKQVRELVSDMKFVSLASEIEQAGNMLQTAGIQLILAQKDQPPLLSSVEETMLALTVREAITNVIKHSRAKTCTIKLENRGDSFCTEIADDGVGIAGNGAGNGFQSMRERIQSLNGMFKVNHSPSGGTVITVKLPLRRKGKENAGT